MTVKELLIQNKWPYATLFAQAGMNLEQMLEIIALNETSFCGRRCLCLIDMVEEAGDEWFNHDGLVGILKCAFPNPFIKFFKDDILQQDIKALAIEVMGVIYFG